MVLSIAISFGWSIKQLDVSNAFLNGKIDEDAYMTRPPGFVDPSKPCHVCHLKKSLYGLKQAPRAWFSTLRDTLLAFGFKDSHTDQSLFYYNANGVRAFFLVYVDDILLMGSFDEFIQSVMDYLSSKFAIKDLGALSYFLGVEACWDKNGVLLTQTKYIKDILARTHMSKFNSVSTLVDYSTKTTKSPKDNDVFHATLDRQVVGSLQYLSITRPDLAFAISKATQHMHDLKHIHWTHVKCILHYLAGTIDMGIYLRKSNNLQLHIYYDADWGGSKLDRKSTTGFTIYLGPNLISWRSKKQQAVSRSSTKFEYRAIATATSELLWLQSLLQEIGFSLPCAPTLWYNNLGATYLTASPIFYTRSRHL